MTNEQVRWIALFFFLSLMEERLALQAAHKTVAQLKAMGAADARPETSGAEPSGGSRLVAHDVTHAVNSIQLIRTMAANLEHFKKLLARAKPPVIPDAAWILPESFDIDPWMKFQKRASENEVIAVILGKVLPFTDQEIAEGLNVSIGTARYRIGKGVRQLGDQCAAVARRG